MTAEKLASWYNDAVAEGFGGPRLTLPGDPDRPRSSPAPAAPDANDYMSSAFVAEDAPATTRPKKKQRRLVGPNAAAKAKKTADDDAAAEAAAAESAAQSDAAYDPFLAALRSERKSISESHAHQGISVVECGSPHSFHSTDAPQTDADDHQECDDIFDLEDALAAARRQCSLYDLRAGVR